MRLCARLVSINTEAAQMLVARLAPMRYLSVVALAPGDACQVALQTHFIHAKELLSAIIFLFRVFISYRPPSLLRDLWQREAVPARALELTGARQWA